MPMRENPEASIEIDSVAVGDEISDENWWVFDSSRVAEAAYSPRTDQLFVRFVKPVPGTVEYVYEGVPENVWRNMRRSASPGKFINRVLNGYDYHRTRH